MISEDDDYSLIMKIPLLPGYREHRLWSRSAWVQTAVLLTSFTACSSPAELPEPSPAAPASNTQEVESAAVEVAHSGGHYVPPATFTPCRQDPEVGCGTMMVPLDYDQPNGPQIEIFTVRLPATSPNKKGILFVNPGGPGGSGAALVVYGKTLFTELRQDFDIVSFDPRGQAGSGSFFCPFALPPAPATYAEFPAFHDEIGRRAIACTQQLGPLATKIGTTNVARDMDRFRAALRERKLSYLGFSYGSILGASYASQFPHRTRAMVLDGVLSPSWLGDHLVELETEGSSGAELALQRVEVLCRADAACPLRVAGVTATFDRLLQRLTATPAPVEGGVIDADSIQAFVFDSLYLDETLPNLVRVLAQADNGDYSGLSFYTSPATPSNNYAVNGLFAVLCNDLNTRLSGTDYNPIYTSNRLQHRRLASLAVGRAMSVCSRWPQQATPPVVNFSGRNPILLINNDFDPATVMPWARDMATALGSKAHLLRYTGGGHTAYANGITCIDDLVHSYLRDLALPARGTTCTAPPISFEPAALKAARAPRMAEILRTIAPSRPDRAELR